MRTIACTHPGRVRSANEDAYLALGGFAVVADGMGGHAHGEIAARLAVSAFAELAETDPLTAADILAAVSRANGAILAETERQPELAGMGTTLTGIARVLRAARRTGSSSTWATRASTAWPAHG